MGGGPRQLCWVDYNPMSYLVLARKYRPRTFAEVAGQSNVTRVLRGAIREGRIGHSYLFTGPRGTGKTTSARLLAKALNCEQGPIEEPCGTCERCLALDAGSEVDIMEIDAATHTGVDNIRDLRDQASYVPIRARFKIYIVDEVHMLSTGAFNALLKTLEEPPPHVKFLFATTELHKVPETVLSRCQVLHLTPLPEDVIATRLDEVFALEGVSAEDGVTADLARRARGGMRDALSLADQLLALVGEEPTLQDCERLAGEGSAQVAEAVLDHVLAGDRAGLLQALPPQEGRETDLVTGLLTHLRSCLMAALCGPDGPPGPLLPTDRAAVEALAAKGKTIGARRLELMLQDLLHARERMRLLPSHRRLILEVTLLEMSHPEASVDLSSLVQRLGALETQLGAVDPAGGEHRGEHRGGPRGTLQPSSAVAPPLHSGAVPPSDGQKAAPVTNQPQGEAGPSADPPRSSDPSPSPADPAAIELGSGTASTNSAADIWGAFIEQLSELSPSLGNIVSKCGHLQQYRSGRAVVKMSHLSPTDAALVGDRRNHKQLGRAFSLATGKPTEVVIADADQSRPGADDPFTEEVARSFDGKIID